MLDSISSEGEREVIYLRTGVVEGLGPLEAVADEVLALRLAGDASAFETLYGELLPSLGLDQKVKTLLTLLERDDQHESYPFLALFPGTSTTRHLLAHNALNIYESTDDVLVFEGRRRGQDQVREVLMNQLRRADAVIYHVTLDLWTLRDRIRKVKDQQGSVMT